MKATAIDPHTPDWSQRLRALRQRLQNRPTLLPHHFLQAALPKIGGTIFAVGPAQQPDSPSGYAFLLPRASTPAGRVYTLRYEPAPGPPAADPQAVVSAVQAELPPKTGLVFYRPDAPQRFTPSQQIVDGVACGHPDAAEAAAIRQVQQDIWHSPPDGLYPSDIHSDDAGLGTSLVARVAGRVAGFLLGFYRFGGPHLPPDWHGYRQDLRLESQLLAVDPAQRGRGIGRLLKRVQAGQALAAGIDLISWTTDPLLYPNALLNFTRLGAVAWQFQPDLYDFRNELNRVSASRLHLLWPLRAEGAQAALAGERAGQPVAIDAAPDVAVVNRAGAALNFAADSRRIAIEIPADWVALQRENPEAAQTWRDATDRLLGHYLGLAAGQYILTGTGTGQGRCYLIGERVAGEN